MKLSVLMLAYNQEAFIREALDSVLAQQTTFDFEVVIGEDCSTDTTRSIIQSYQAAHPGKIRGLYRAENVGMIENFIQTYRSCRGDYIAVLEGDDYWVDPLKLQKQIDFFDAHPDFSICFHDSFVRTDSPDLRAMPRMRPPEQKKVLHFFELLVENCIPTASVMWRNLGTDVRFPEGLHGLKFTDWLVHLMHAQYGPVGFIPEAMSVRRISSNGVWTRLDVDTQLQATIDAYKVIDKYFKQQYSGMIEWLINHYQMHLSLRCTSAEARRLEPKEKQLVAAIIERNQALIECGHLQNHLKAQSEVLRHLVASRAVRIGMVLSRIANVPGQILRALKAPLKFR